MKTIEDKYKDDALLRKKIEELSKENGVLKMEIALLKHEIEERKKAKK